MHAIEIIFKFLKAEYASPKGSWNDVIFMLHEDINYMQSHHTHVSRDDYVRASENSGRCPANVSKRVPYILQNW